jgi:hypothetical protein
LRRRHVDHATSYDAVSPVLESDHDAMAPADPRSARPLIGPSFITCAAPARSGRRSTRMTARRAQDGSAPCVAWISTARGARDRLIGWNSESASEIHTIESMNSRCYSPRGPELCLGPSGSTVARKLATAAAELSFSLAAASTAGMAFETSKSP